LMEPKLVLKRSNGPNEEGVVKKTKGDLQV
jgi:hypothetical protein